MNPKYFAVISFIVLLVIITIKIIDFIQTRQLKKEIKLLTESCNRCLTD